MIYIQRVKLLVTHLAAFFFGFLFLFFTCKATAQSNLEIPLGTTPVFDGIITTSEWSDADSVFLNTPGGDCKVLYKHDCLQLNVAFLGHLESANANFPEVLIDVQNDKSAAWMNDDWWFHVSGTDCYSQGAYGDFSNCSLVQPDWIGIPNISNGGSITDSIEIQIPFSTAGISSASDTIGISFLVTNTFSTWNLWPATANTSSPATWGTATFAGCATGNKELENPDFFIYPNPVADRFTLSFHSALERSIQLYNSSGELVYKIEIQDKSTEIDVLNLTEGIYLLKIDSKNGVSMKSIFKM